MVYKTRFFQFVYLFCFFIFIFFAICFYFHNNLYDLKNNQIILIRSVNDILKVRLGVTSGMF